MAQPAHLKALGSKTWAAFGSDATPEQTLHVGRPVLVSGPGIWETRPTSLSPHTGTSRAGEARPAPARVGSRAPHRRQPRLPSLRLHSNGLAACPPQRPPRHTDGLSSEGETPPSRAGPLPASRAPAWARNGGEHRPGQGRPDRSRQGPPTRRRCAHAPRPQRTRPFPAAFRRRMRWGDAARLGACAVLLRPCLPRSPLAGSVAGTAGAHAQPGVLRHVL